MEDVFWNDKNTVSEFVNRPCSKYITDEIDKICKNKVFMNVIDIGCGGGRYSRYIKNKGFDIVAIDKNIEMVKSVQNIGINAIQCEMSNLPFQNEFFDLALSIGVIHNSTRFCELENSLKEIYRILKDNGQCLVSVFTNKLITNDLCSIGNNEYVFENGRPPMVLISDEEFIELCHQCGFKECRIIDEHITNVGTGERNVLSIHLIK